MGRQIDRVTVDYETCNHTIQTSMESTYNDNNDQMDEALGMLFGGGDEFFMPEDEELPEEAPYESPLSDDATNGSEGRDEAVVETNPSSGSVWQVEKSEQASKEEDIPVAGEACFRS